ncbi:MAG: hypothetical protein MJ109_00625 [Kiritimatiellae bacterium]|nr:hypothetical protein [Kiritimatiellia bacterium]
MANLTQLKALENLDGFLLVDKPAGIAFSSIVKTIKRRFGLIKVGHGGSLDTMASGLFILLIGDANKFVDRVMNETKEFEGTIDFSRLTNTGDIYGENISSPSPTPSPDLSQFRGDVFLTEPKFCSVKKEGEALYSVVDTGEHKQFMAHVYRLEVKDLGQGQVEVQGQGVKAFSLKCDKNVIVRALVRDMGGTLASLRRTKIGKFSIEEAIRFDMLLETEMKDFASCVMPLSKALR